MTRLSLRLGLGASGLLASVLALAPACNTYPEDLKAGLSNVNPGDLACKWGDCWWSKTTPEGCKAATRPTPSDRPAKSSAPSVDPVYFAIDQLKLGESELEGQTPGIPVDDILGFDLDGVCSNSATCLQAESDRYGCKAVSQQDDGELCRDNLFAALEKIAAGTSLGTKFGISENAFNCGFRRGSNTILFKLSEYNGLPDDDTVRVDIYASPGVKTLPTWSCCTNTNWQGEARFPKGTPWYVDEADLEGRAIEAPGTLPNSRLADSSAYVRQGYLYANLPDGAILRFPGDRGDYPGFALRVHQGFVTGKLTKVGRDYEVSDGIIAGRLGGADLVKSFVELGFTEPREKTNWGLLNSYLGTSLDVLLNGETDPTGQAQCDAMSMGLYFRAVPVVPGESLAISALVSNPPPPAPRKCGQTYDDDVDSGGGGTGGSGAGGTGGAAGASGGAAGADGG